MRMDGVDSSLRIVGVRVAKALLTVAAMVTSLTLVGIDMTAFSVFTGALGVGLGLGMQTHRQQLRFRLHHPARPFDSRIGNVVQVGGTGGQVTQITTRYTVLKNTGGSRVHRPQRGADLECRPEPVVLGYPAPSDDHAWRRLRLRSRPRLSV
jgi:small-conductance mechanosensitive channel